VDSDGVRIVIAHKHRRRLVEHVEHAIGSVARPMTDRDLADKFARLTEGVVPDVQARVLAEICWRLEALPDMAELTRLAAVPRYHPQARRRMAGRTGRTPTRAPEG
jgi:2-methylcitrate dehydratase PrpD